MVSVYVIICKLLAKPECESQGGGELGTSNFCRCFVAGSTGTQLIPVNSSSPRSTLSNMHSITEPESLAWTGFSQVPQSKAVGEPDWVNSGSMSTEPYLLIKDDLAFNVKATRCSGHNIIHKLYRIWYVGNERRFQCFNESQISHIIKERGKYGILPSPLPSK